MKHGINLQLWYTARNSNGLHGVATDYAHTIAFGADVDLGKLGIDRGGTIGMWMTEGTGGELGPEKLGSLFQTQETMITISVGEEHGWRVAEGPRLQTGSGG